MSFFVGNTKKACAGSNHYSRAFYLKEDLMVTPTAGLRIESGFVRAIAYQVIVLRSIQRFPNPETNVIVVRNEKAPRLERQILESFLRLPQVETLLIKRLHQ